MFFKISIALALGFLAMGFNLSPEITSKIQQTQEKVGGYHVVNQKYLASDPQFQSAEKIARSSYQEQYNGELGNLILVQEQVVAGVNYKMTFESANGPVQVVVFSQPWTDTMQVTGITQL